MPDPILTPIIGPTPSDPPTYSPGIAETFSWIPVENDARPLFAKASYIVNLKDLTISLSAADVIIGAVELSDPTNHSIRANVVQLGGGNGNALQIIEARPISAVRINGTAAVSGSITMTNPTTSVRVTNTVDVSGSITMTNPTTSVRITNTVDVSGSVNIGTMPEVEIKNDANNPIPVTGTFVTTSPVGATDSFGRQRVSNPLTLFDSSHRYRDNNLWNTSTTGTATATFNAAQGLIDLTVNNLINTEIIRETTKVFPYQPGKSLLVLNTFVMSPAKSGLRQRIGYYGTANGMYVELDSSTLSLVERTSVGGSLAENRIAQSSWNGDKLNGTGTSGLTLDITKAQILWMDIEWLGVGSVRMGFIINGQFIVCHTFHHANIIASTYITTASLPLRYEIKNNTGTTGSSTLKQICSTVISEGGYELRGLQQAINIPVNAPRTLPTAGTYYPVIGLRLKATALDAIVILTAISMMPISTGAYEWQVRASGTVNSGSWVSAGVDSGVEYNITGTSVTDGRILASGFFNASNQGVTQVDILKEALFKFQLERNGLTGVPYELALVITSNGGGDTVVASVDWEEISR
jgi:hypothetical protein